MQPVVIKGKTYTPIAIKDSFSRRAVFYRNAILATLRKIGLTEDDSDIPLEAIAFKKAPAHASFYVAGRHVTVSYSHCSKFAENLYIVSKVIDAEIADLLNEVQTLEQFVEKFAEEHDVAASRREAREILGLDEKTTDIEEINRAYKELAKQHHPDKEGGDTEKFKKINRAHKTLKRELVQE